MTYEQIEDDLVSRFFDTIEISGTPTLVKKSDVFFEIAPLPDFEAQYVNNQNPRAWVIFNNSDYSDRENLDIVFQEDKMQIAIEVHSRTRRGDTGIFAIQKIIFKYLLGFKILGCDKLQLVAFNPLEGCGPGSWKYVILFSTVSHIMQKSEPEPTEPKLKEIIIK